MDSGSRMPKRWIKPSNVKPNCHWKCGFGTKPKFLVLGLQKICANDLMSCELLKSPELNDVFFGQRCGEKNIKPIRHISRHFRWWRRGLVTRGAPMKMLFQGFQKLGRLLLFFWIPHEPYMTHVYPFWASFTHRSWQFFCFQDQVLTFIAKPRAAARGNGIFLFQVRPADLRAPRARLKEVVFVFL